MTDYSALARFVKDCEWIVEEAKAIRTSDDFPEEYEEPLTSVWQVLDILKNEGHVDKEMMNQLEYNIRTLAKADLLEQLLHVIELAERKIQ